MPHFQHLKRQCLGARFMRRFRDLWWDIEDLPLGGYIAPFAIGSLIGVVLNAAIWGVSAILDPAPASVVMLLLLSLAWKVWRYRAQQNSQRFEDDFDDKLTAPSGRWLSVHGRDAALSPQMSSTFSLRCEDTTNTWLIPLSLIQALGTFDLDPCCPPTMPWQTATEMHHYPDMDAGFRAIGEPQDAS